MFASVMRNIEVLGKYSRIMVETIKKLLRLKDIAKNELSSNSVETATETLNNENPEYLNFIIEDIEPLLNETKKGLGYIKEISMDINYCPATNIYEIDNETGAQICNLNEIIQDAANQIKTNITPHGTIEIKPGKIPPVLIKKHRLYQAIFNIMFNAAHAIKDKTDGTGVITVSTYKEGSFICCNIKDNGRGMPEEELKNIFEPYYTTKASREGSGLGLF